MADRLIATFFLCIAAGIASMVDKALVASKSMIMVVSRLS